MVMRVYGNQPMPTCELFVLVQISREVLPYKQHCIASNSVLLLVWNTEQIFHLHSCVVYVS